MLRARLLTALTFAALLGSTGWALGTLEISNRITDFLPEGTDPREAALSSALADSELTRTLVLSIGGAEPDALRAAARELGDDLREDPRVAWLRSGIDDDLEEAVYDLYWPRRAYFLSDTPERLPELLSDEGLREEAAALKERLAGAASPFVRRLAPDDPLLAFLGQMERLEEAREGDLTVVDGQLVTEDGSHAILFVATKASAFDAAAQRAFLTDLDRAFSELRAALGEGLVLERSGAHPFTVASERSIRADVTRISVVSTLAVVLLFLVLFRGLRAAALTFVPVLSGVAAALVASAILLGTIHGITLAFGAALIGVCVDYAVHLQTHHALGEPGETPRQSLARVWPGLLLGASTTLAGLAGLAWTSFPGIREIALFSTVGVLVALLATRFLLPPWMPEEPGGSRLQRRLAGALGNGLGALQARRRTVGVILGLGAVVVAGVGIPRLTWEDDIAALNALDPALVAEDQRVRERVSRLDTGRLVVATAPTLAAALEKNDRVARTLEDARAANEIGGFRSLHTLLWSESLQRANAEALREREDLDAAIARGLEAEGFVPEAFSLDGAYAPGAPPLRYEDLLGSPLAPLAQPFVVALPDGFAVLTFLREVTDAEALRARFADGDGFFFDQRAWLEDAYGRYRQRTLELIGVGLVLVFALVAIRYRRAGPALAAFLPALAAAGVTLGILGLLGHPANLMHLVALLLVLSIGVDYGVFVVEHRGHPGHVAATLLSILIACTTTSLSFGLLAMSANPALRSLGLAVGVGVVVALVLAPTALVLAAEPTKAVTSKEGNG